MHYGFTGTREGMTRRQREAVFALLADRLNHMTMGETRFADWFHHGCCVGADEQAHELARRLELLTEGHPPVDQSRMALLICDRMNRPRSFMRRNYEIVQSVVEVIAAPRGMHEEPRHSGTWATVRLARRAGRLVSICYPDGSYQFSP